MSARVERTPQHPLRFTAREISLAREVRRDAIGMLGPKARLNELPKEVQDGLQAGKRVSALVSLCHVLGTIGGIEVDLLQEHIAERLSKQLETELQAGSTADVPHLRPVSEIEEAERLLRKSVEHPIHQMEEESVQPRGRLSDMMDDSARNLVSAMRGEGIIDAYDFVLGENNWISDIIENSRRTGYKENPPNLKEIKTSVATLLQRATDIVNEAPLQTVDQPLDNLFRVVEYRSTLWKENGESRKVIVSPGYNKGRSTDTVLGLKGFLETGDHDLPIVGAQNRYTELSTHPLAEDEGRETEWIVRRIIEIDGQTTTLEIKTGQTQVSGSNSTNTSATFSVTRNLRANNILRQSTVIEVPQDDREFIKDHDELYKLSGVIIATGQAARALAAESIDGDTFSLSGPLDIDACTRILDME